MNANKQTLFKSIASSFEIKINVLSFYYIDFSRFITILINVTGYENLTTSNSNSATVEFKMPTTFDFIIVCYKMNKSNITSFSNLKQDLTTNGTLLKL